ncbi:GspE/PulE family protein [Celerinatantimonas diazotrophica]|nr:GspE/PulE family protein [Celerinatantimonas diazotrophica]
MTDTLCDEVCHSDTARNLLARLKTHYPNRRQRWLLTLVKQHSINEHELYQAACRRSHLPTLDLPHQVTMLPGQLKLHHLLDFQVILTSHYAGVLQVGLIDCEDQLLIDELANLSQQEIEPLVVHPHWLATQLTQLSETAVSSATAPSAPDNQDDNIAIALSQLIYQASLSGISDLHFEPVPQGYRVRARIDGLLQYYYRFTSEQGPRVVSWLKMNANLDIAQKMHPQDGRLHLPQWQAHPLDIRVSTLPTIHGEKVVLRLLGSDQQHLSLSQLGMDEAQLTRVYYHLQQPSGLIIVTGPTGSGKTRTLYAALSHLNHPSVNIASVEDPVEIELAGINQVAVNPAAQLTFENVLRALLRQDPDILMLGEIRDQQTLEIAWHAAQTGHRVLSTLHTNSALKSIERLHQLGLSYHQISESLQLIIAQRLLRKLCPKCRVKTADDQYLPQGCRHCHDGYHGRIGIFELLSFNAAIRQGITHQLPMDELEHIAYQQGMRTLYQQATEYVRQGITTSAEILRVLGHAPE